MENDKSHCQELRLSVIICRVTWFQLPIQKGTPMAKQKGTSGGTRKPVSRNAADAEELAQARPATLEQESQQQELPCRLSGVTEHRKADEVLEHSETKLQAALSSIKEALFIADAQGRFIDFNDEFVRYHRFKDREECSREISECAKYIEAYLEDGTPAPNDMWAMPRALRGETASDVVYKLRRKDTGETWWGSYCFGPIKDKDGAIVGAVVSGREITDRRRIEEALQVTQERNTAILNGIADTFYSLDRQWRFTLVNPAAERAPFGRPASELVGRVIWELYPGLIGTSIQRHYLDAAAKLCLEHYEAQSPLNGRWYEVFMQGWTAGVDVYMRDITERKQAEEALQESEERFRAIASNTPDHVLVQDRDLRYTMVLNPQIGLTEPDMIGKTDHDFLEPMDADKLTAIKKRVLETGEPIHVETSLVNREGHEEFFEGSYVPKFDSSGRIDGLIGYFRNVTDRKKAEGALREANETLERRVQQRTWELSAANERIGAEHQRLYDVLETLPAYVCLLAPDYHMPFANRTFRELFGDSRGRRCFEFLFGRTEPCERCETYNVLKTNAPQRWEWTGPNGRTYDVFDFPFLDTDGSAMILEMGVDITDWRNAEKALRDRTGESEQRAAQLRALAAELTRTEERERRRLAEVLHDELQQLLVATKLRASMLSNPLDRQNIVELVNQSINTSRSVTSELSPPILYDGDLPTALEGLARQKRDKYGLTVDLRLERSADPGTLDGRVLLFRGARELLTNAHKHANVSKAVLWLQRDKGNICLQVADEGIGFDQEALAKRADRGFGLFSLRERLEPLGGRVEVDSAPGRGTRVTLVLPALEKMPASEVRMDPHEPIEGPEMKDGPAIRVLVVDDHKIVRQGLAGLLASCSGIQVIGEAGDGLEAVEQARRLRPDVIVMDINLPHMSGLEATKAILGEMPHVRVIGLSGHSRDDMEIKMRQAGATAYLDKSGPAEDLIAQIRACRK